LRHGLEDRHVARKHLEEAGEPFRRLSISPEQDLSGRPVDPLGKRVDRDTQRARKPQRRGDLRFVGRIAFKVRYVRHCRAAGQLIPTEAGADS
jgi:hypothetical protein